MSRGSLIVVGTGIQWAGQTTLAARRAIEQADRVLFAVADPWAARWVCSLNPGAESLPYPQDGRPRRQIYREMVDRILAELRKGLRVCAVFYGHPGVLTRASHEAVLAARDAGLSALMLPGVSALDCLYADLGVDPGQAGCQIYETTDFLVRGRPFDAYTALVLCQIGAIGNLGTYDLATPESRQRGLAILTEVLGTCFPPEHEVVIYEASTHPLQPPRIERRALSHLPDAVVSEISTLYVPPRGTAPTRMEMLARLGLKSLPDQDGNIRRSPPSEVMP
jgi:hypothetical protein